jgi:hypothetical protein
VAGAAEKLIVGDNRTAIRAVSPDLFPAAHPRTIKSCNDKEFPPVFEYPRAEPGRSPGRASSHGGNQNNKPGTMEQNDFQKVVQVMDDAGKLMQQNPRSLRFQTGIPV